MKVLALALLSVAAAPLHALDAADDQYQFVSGLYDKGMYDMVVEEASQFLRSHPQHERADHARYRLALALFELGRPSDASSHFSRLARDSSFEYRRESALRWAQCLIEEEQFPQALEALGDLTRSDEAYLRVPALFLSGEAEFRTDDFRSAERHYTSVLDVSSTEEGAPYAEKALLGLTWCAFRLGDHQRAAETARVFVGRHGRSALASEARFLLGESHLELGQYREAIDAYRQVGEGAHRDGALRGIGFAFAGLEDHDRAASAFAELLQQFPDSRYAEEVRFHRGIQLYRAERIEEAVTELTSRDLGDTPEILYWRALALRAGGDPEAALATLDRAQRGNPSGRLAEDMATLRGDVLFDLGRDQEAVRAHRQAGSEYSLYSAAVASLNRGDAAEAQELIAELLRDHPDGEYRGDALLALGESLFAQEDYTRAEDSFGRAVEELGDRPGAVRAHSRIAWCRYFADDLSGAASEFHRLYRHHPEAPEAEEALFMAGRAHLLSDKAEQALSLWSRYLETFPRGDRRDQVYFEIARLQSGLEAEPWFEALLRDYPASPLVPDALFEWGERLSAEGRWGDAQQRYGQLAEQHPDSEWVPAALYGQAWTHYEREEFAEGSDVLRELQRRQGLEPQLLASALELRIWCEAQGGSARNIAAAYRDFAEHCTDEERLLQAARTVVKTLRESGRQDEAQGLLRELLNRVRGEGAIAEALVEGVFLSLEQGDVQDAEAQVLAAHERAPGNAAVSEALFFVGEAHFDRRQDERAVRLYQLCSAAETGTLAGRALYKQGFAQLRLENYAGAARAFEALVTQHTDSDLRGEGLFLLGESLFQDGQLADSIQWFEELRRRMPDHELMPKALFRLGVALATLERWEQARSVLIDLARRFPEFDNGDEAELWRGRAAVHMGDRRGARQAFERVIQRDRGVLAAQARLELGKLHLADGETEEALSQFLKVAMLYAHSAEVSEALYLAGQCLEKLGNEDQAIEQYREIVNEHPDTAFASQARTRLRELKVP